MTTLEIVFTAVLGAVILAIVIAVIATRLFNRFRLTRVQEYNLMNKYSKTGGTVFLGDSITEMYHVHEFFPTIQIYNRGISGNTTDEVISRLEENVVSISPSRVFLLIGTNDLANNSSRNVERTYNNIITIITTLQEKIKNVEVNVLSIYPISKKKSKFSRLFILLGRNNTNTQIINAKLKDYCEVNHMTFIDVYPHLIDEQGNLKREYTNEGLHLSIEGYNQVTKVLHPYVVKSGVPHTAK